MSFSDKTILHSNFTASPVCVQIAGAGLYRLNIIVTYIVA